MSDDERRPRRRAIEWHEDRCARLLEAGPLQPPRSGDVAEAEAHALMAISLRLGELAEVLERQLRRP